MMKKLLIALALIASLTTPRVFAAFEDNGTGARGTALGSNYVSMGDDVLSLMYNPASLARVHDKEITTEYSKLYTGLSDGSNLSQYYFGYGQPIGWGGTLAFGWKQLSLDSLYSERTLSLGYGEWLTQDIAIGGALKQLHHSFGVPSMIVDDNGNIQAGTPSFFAQNGNSNTAYAGDLGVLYHMTERHTLGISIQNINEPNVALNPADHEIVPREVQMSLAYDAHRRLTLAAGVMTEESLANEQDYTWTGSAEKWWKLSEGDEVAIRGSLATGSREFQQMVLGAGYRMTSLELDYAYVFNLTGITPGDSMGTHRFSLTYRFGAVAAGKEKAKPKQAGQQNRWSVPWSAPAKAPQAAPRSGLPRDVDIQITPEEIEGTPAPLKVEDWSIGVVFDSDYDGVPDDQDQCPDTPFGEQVDARGCAPSQLDHQGNPLPKKVQIEFLPLEEVGQ
jgi:hypothetical protein